MLKYSIENLLVRIKQMNNIDILDTAVSINGQVLSFPISYDEIKQFKKLKKMLIFGNENDAKKLRKICEPLGIEIEAMGAVG